MSHVDVVRNAILASSGMSILWEIFLFISFVHLATIRRVDFYLLVVVTSLVVLVLHVLPIRSLSSLSRYTFSRSFFCCDYLSFWLRYLVLFITIVRFLVAPKSSLTLSFMVLTLILSCLVVFGASDLLSLYVCYEFSLIPILYIVVYSGTYPDRAVRASIIFIYTAIFSFPFMLYVIHSIVSLGTASFSLIVPSLWGFRGYVLALAFITFLVKLPVYGIHFWLPIAHVEAPTYGSMLLAGLLLKIGGCGLYRISYYTRFRSFSYTFTSYIMLSLVFSSVVCCLQSDFKRLVAYSSVAHMIVVAASVVLCSPLSISAFVLIMVTHGITSPILFMLVGITYRMFGTRMLSVYRGLLIVSPLLSAFIILCFGLSVPVPPSLAFLGEVQFVTALVSVYLFSSFIAFLFVFVGILYNLLWFGSLLGSSSTHRFSNLTFSLNPREGSTLLFIGLQAPLTLILIA